MAETAGKRVVLSTIYSGLHPKYRPSKTKAPLGAFRLFFRLLVHRMLAAPVAILVELNLAFNELFVLARPIVYALAAFAGEFYKLIL